MPRSVWKGPFVHNKTLKTKIWKRNSTILPQFEGKTFNVHNGLKFVPIYIKETMIGHKFGEFVNTRKRFIYKKIKKKVN